MTELLYYTICALGLTCILKYGNVLHAPRKFLCSKSSYLEELFSCSLCLGFWSGAVIASFIYYVSPDWHNGYFLFPLFSAASCWSLDSIIGILNYTERYIANK